MDISDTTWPNVLFPFVPLMETDPEEATLTLASMSSVAFIANSFTVICTFTLKVLRVKFSVPAYFSSSS